MTLNCGYGRKDKRISEKIYWKKITEQRNYIKSKKVKTLHSQFVLHPTTDHQLVETRKIN